MPVPQQPAPKRKTAFASPTTATFQPYYREAYNEIVQPERIDNYLIRRWLPSLGPLGFALVKALRNRCYYNPSTGVVRDSVELDMAELAAAVGMSERTIYREFAENTALQQFVRRVEQYNFVSGSPRRRANLYQVSMDDPIFPDDIERYECLRAQRETVLDQPPIGRVVHRPGPERPAVDCHLGSQAKTPSPVDCHLGSQAGKTPAVDCQDGADARHLGGVDCQDGAALVSLPSGGTLPMDLFTPAAGDPQKGQGDPERPEERGEERRGDVAAQIGESLTLSADALLRSAWRRVLGALRQLANEPTYKMHLARLQPRRFDDAAGVVEILCPSAFTRDWMESRHGEDLPDLFGQALGRAVTIRLIVSAPSADKIDSTEREEKGGRGDGVDGVDGAISNRAIGADSLRNATL